MPTYELKWSTLAVQDLEEALEYVRVRNPSAAAAMAERIDRSVVTLSEYPRAGKYDPDAACYEWAIPGLRYMLIYTVIDDKIEIIALFPTSRDPAAKRRP